ncbi:nuclear transport factor 2 family protein [Actinokineospora pegani]|uniref:nuclear transport factor 2 family protein n=1 Tax=Actinokineospora pegani TaxID=2654637 RepID=UPI0018D34313|nr:nuclear transport factor 2 family protein [Actinokineospora pegani]
MTTAETLRAAERRLQAAQLGSDTAVLDELIDDAMLFTGPDGGVLTKQDDLDAHNSGQQKLTRLEEEDLRVHVSGATGVTWFLGSLEATTGDQPFTARVRYTRTWTHDGTAWRVIAAHAGVVA